MSLAPATGVTPLGALVWAHFLNDGLANYLPGILPLLAVALHLPLAPIAGLMSVLLFGQMLQPVSGILADRAGGRGFAVWGPVLTTAGVVGVAVTRSYWMLAALFLITGIGNTVFHPQALSITRSATHTRHGVTMSVFLIGGEIGRALGPLAAGWIVATMGLKYIWVMAVPLALTWPWMTRLVPKMTPKKREGRPIQWRRHLKPGVALIVFSGLRALLLYGMSTFLPILWHQRGGSLVEGASLVTTFVGVGVAGTLGAGAVMDRLGKRTVLWGASLATLVLVSFVPLVRGDWLWPLVGILGITAFGSIPVTLLIGQDIFSENPAMGSGVALGLANGVGALLLPLWGFFADHVGISAAMWAGTGMILASLPFIAAMPTHPPVEHS
ncbi:MAG: MFS transporter [Sulfobacillus acidophilus]|uniref:MFS transporter n=1 Tax=Sulfobacillus acidophilus TaxID=53633 RepID=A0A2T2WD25_9FIRM|nr:MAG: MFS transporter [Sulfobacillus acidophilus]